MPYLPYTLYQIMWTLISLPLKMAERLRRVQPVSVANHVKACQSPIEHAVTWLATESSWAQVNVPPFAVVSLAEASLFRAVLPLWFQLTHLKFTAETDTLTRFLLLWPWPWPWSCDLDLYAVILTHKLELSSYVSHGAVYICFDWLIDWLTCRLWRCNCKPEMNFICQDFHYTQTQTDRLDRTHYLVSVKNVCCVTLSANAPFRVAAGEDSWDGDKTSDAWRAAAAADWAAEHHSSSWCHDTMASCCWWKEQRHWSL